MTRKTVYYSGRVQGVGFRFTAERIARHFAVTGYVKNLDDGRVELVAEGEAAELRRLLDAVADAMQGHIRQAQVVESSATGEFGGFQIQHER